MLFVPHSRKYLYFLRCDWLLTSNSANQDMEKTFHFESACKGHKEQKAKEVRSKNNKEVECSQHKKQTIQS